MSNDRNLSLGQGVHSFNNTPTESHVVQVDPAKVVTEDEKSFSGEATTINDYVEFINGFNFQQGLGVSTPLTPDLVKESLRLFTYKYYQSNCVSILITGRYVATKTYFQSPSVGEVPRTVFGKDKKVFEANYGDAYVSTVQHGAEWCALITVSKTKSIKASAVEGGARVNLDLVKLKVDVSLADLKELEDELKKHDLINIVLKTNGIVPTAKASTELKSLFEFINGATVKPKNEYAVIDYKTSPYSEIIDPIPGAVFDRGIQQAKDLFNKLLQEGNKLRVLQQYLSNLNACASSASKSDPVLEAFLRRAEKLNTRISDLKTLLERNKADLTAISAADLPDETIVEPVEMTQPPHVDDLSRNQEAQQNAIFAKLQKKTNVLCRKISDLNKDIQDYINNMRVKCAQGQYLYNHQLEFPMILPSGLVKVEFDINDEGLPGREEIRFALSTPRSMWGALGGKELKSGLSHHNPIDIPADDALHLHKKFIIDNVQPDPKKQFLVTVNIVGMDAITILYPQAKYLRQHEPVQDVAPQMASYSKRHGGLLAFHEHEEETTAGHDDTVYVRSHAAAPEPIPPQSLASYLEEYIWVVDEAKSLSAGLQSSSIATATTSQVGSQSSSLTSSGSSSLYASSHAASLMTSASSRVSAESHGSDVQRLPVSRT